METNEILKSRLTINNQLLERQRRIVKEPDQRSHSSGLLFLQRVAGLLFVSWKGSPGEEERSMAG
jgi:hypothetical protein